MSELVEAAGGPIEGGMYARAVEPGAGEDQQNTEGACLNCGTMLVGPHCHRCGQKARVHRTISAFVHDLVHGALHFEGKIWHTLPLLALKPGELTRRYIDGERARFVSPMALFLFSIFLMFAVFQVMGLSAPTQVDGANTLNGAFTQARGEAEAERDSARERLSDLSMDDPARAEARTQLNMAEERLADLDEAEALASDDFNITGIAGLDQGVVKKWRENPSLMLYKLQANGYKFSWLLIPISVPFVWLLFAWRSRFNAYDHSVFVTYSLSFMTLFFAVLSLFGIIGLGGAWLIAAGFVIAPIHIYMQLRGAYGLSRFSGLWRLAVLLLFITVIVTLFLQTLLLLGGMA